MSWFVERLSETPRVPVSSGRVHFGNRNVRWYSSLFLNHIGPVRFTQQQWISVICHAKCAPMAHINILISLARCHQCHKCQQCDRCNANRYHTGFRVQVFLFRGRLSAHNHALKDLSALNNKTAYCDMCVCCVTDPSILRWMKATLRCGSFGRVPYLWLFFSFRGMCMFPIYPTMAAFCIYFITVHTWNREYEDKNEIY